LALRDLVGLRATQPTRHPDERRRPPRREVGLGSEKRRESPGIEGDTRAQLERGHHAVTGLGVRNAVDRGEDDAGIALQDVLDRPGQEVLAVDAQPFHIAAGEVEVALLVAVAEVAGVELAAPRARRRRLRVVVVAFEMTDARRIDYLADGLLGIHQVALLVEARRRAHAPLLVGNLHARETTPEGARRIAVLARERGADLAGAVAVDYSTAEPPREGLDVLPRRFVAVRDAQRRVGVVGSLRRRHDVGERA